MDEIILGVQGFNKNSHDAAAALLINGELISMAEEERFTRKKHAINVFPHNAIQYCLNKANITISEVNQIGVGFDYKKLYPEIRDFSSDDFFDLYFPRSLFKYSKKPKLEFVDHHLAHAYSAFYASGFDESSILILDGQGENASGTLAYGDEKKIEIISQIPIESSLGAFYEAITQFIGFSGLDLGKTMGLAPYGKNIDQFDEFSLKNGEYKFDRNIPFSGKEVRYLEVRDFWLKILENKYGKLNNSNYFFSNLHNKFEKNINHEMGKNLAKSAQDKLDEIILHLTKALINKTKSHNLCIAGGVALNCTANGKISSHNPDLNIYIPPFPSDVGASIGAAFSLASKKDKCIETASWGPEYSNDEIKSELDRLHISYQSADDISSEVAKLISENNVVAWFQGRMEVGQRALGNRSILGNPLNPNSHFKLNEAKEREQWRPLAPSILSEYIGDYFVQAVDSPFMLFTVEFKKEWKKILSSATHVDGTSRYQSVTRNSNPQYYNLLLEINKVMGHPIVMNTSFNGHEEPIVCSPLDAITSFYRNSINCLAIGDFLVKK